MDKKIYDYWLYGLESIGRKTFIKLKENGMDGEMLYHCKEKDIPSFLSEKQKTILLKEKKKSMEMLLREYERLSRDGIFMSVLGDEYYL